MLKERVEPRISVNKLGEYAATNNATRRRRIVLDQKKPKPYIPSIYSEAQDFIADYLLGNEDKETLFHKVDDFQNSVAGTDWYETRNKVCAEALLSFADFAGKINLNNCELTKGRNDSPKLQVENVDVSVRPELLVTSRKRSGEIISGAVKLHVIKNNTMSEAAGAYTATMLQQFVESQSSHPCDRRLCFVVDVFEQRVFTAPRSHKRLRKDISASCEEIYRAWHEL